MTRIGILGGGLSGLSAAFHLLRTNPAADVTLLEASSRFGGWISSQRNSDGSHFEFGPRSVRSGDATSPLMLRMCEEAGVADHVIPIKEGAPSTRNRFLFVRNQLTKLTGRLLRPAGPFQKPLLPAAWGLLARYRKMFSFVCYDHFISIVCNFLYECNPLPFRPAGAARSHGYNGARRSPWTATSERCAAPRSLTWP